MSLFKRKKNVILSPTTGQLLCIEDVEDPVFSSGAMGGGFAIEPSDNQIFAPIDGTISSIFPTKHAITIEGKQGLKLLIHIGLDTGELNGQGFDLKVVEGDRISKGDIIGNVDFDFIKNQGKGKTIVVIILESETKLTVNNQEVKAKQQIFEID
ncbi:MAG: PTS glucose transporter subunit IIA [Coprobacillus sp.]